MQQGQNTYSPRDVAGVDLPPGPRVFLSHRRGDKAVTEAVADVLAEVGVHYWFDRDDEDVRRAAALGMVGDVALVHGIERGVRHSTRVLGLISAQTSGSWWVPFEIGVGRTAGVPVSFLILPSVPSAPLPEYVRLAANYWSVDEVLVWAGGLRLPASRPAPAIEVRYVEALEQYVPRLPPSPTIADLARSALAAIARLDEPTVWEALALTSEQFDWLPTNGGIVRDLAYDLLAPAALLQILPGQVGTSEQLIAGDVSRAFTRHYEFAMEPPALPYEPNCSGWRTRRYREPASTWLQGLSSDQLAERLTRFFAITDLGGATRLATREEFKSIFDDVLRDGTEQARRSLGVLVNPLLGFTPETRPVFERILACQRSLYELLVA